MNLMRVIILMIAFVACFVFETNAQGRISRPQKNTHHQQQSSSNRPSSNNDNHDNVSVSEPDGYVNGFGYVDLGLPSGTMWATSNLGSSSPTLIGNFYSWAEIKPKKRYTKETYTLNNIPLGDIAGNEQYDAAVNSMGIGWHIPTIKQWKELQEKCTFTTIVLDGVKGVLVEGPNGSKIFFPASGIMNNNGHVEGSSGARNNVPFQNGSKYAECKFWTSSDNKTNNTYRISFSTYFEHPNMIDSFFDKWDGFQIRPVCSIYK